MELASRVREVSPGTAVVFTTAYPDHAVEALDLNAADYVVQPVEEARLRRALTRVLAAGPDPDDPVDVGTAATSVGRVPIHKGDRVVLVDEAAMVHASATRGCSCLKLADERVLASFSLNQLQERPTGDFMRTHRSYLVNLRRVKELVSDFGGGLELVVGIRC